MYPCNLSVDTPHTHSLTQHTLCTLTVSASTHRHIPVWGFVSQEVEVADALELALIHTVMVDVVRNPVGNDHAQDDTRHELYATGALDHKHHQGDVGPVQTGTT